MRRATGSRPEPADHAFNGPGGSIAPTIPARRPHRLPGDSPAEPSAPPNAARLRRLPRRPCSGRFRRTASRATGFSAMFYASLEQGVTTGTLALAPFSPSPSSWALGCRYRASRRRYPRTHPDASFAVHVRVIACHQLSAATPSTPLRIPGSRGRYAHRRGRAHPVPGWSGDQVRYPEARDCGGS
jgi:hypothetical protein